MNISNIAKYAWGVLAYNIGVVLFGAYVRATGSGAGCGSHWPLCNGVVLPRSAQTETIIELTHRLTSGVALLLVGVLFILVFRHFSSGHIARVGATLSLVFILTEALVGAGLVLFGWVADDASVGRAVSISVHLINTFLLLASLSLTAWWISGGNPIKLTGRGLVSLGYAIGFLGILLIGISGAITALGDTLFPVDSLVEGVRQDFSTSSHFLVRLRVWHPVVAIMVGFYAIFISLLTYLFIQKRQTRLFAILLLVLFIIQLLVGIVNLVLLAPIWIQIVHLLLADLVWITFVLLAANTFAVQGATDQPEPELISKDRQALKLVPETDR